MPFPRSATFASTPARRHEGRHPVTYHAFFLSRNPSLRPGIAFARVLVLTILLALSLTSLKAQAQTYAEQTLHNFQGQPTD